MTAKREIARPTDPAIELDEEWKCRFAWEAVVAQCVWPGRPREAVTVTNGLGSLVPMENDGKVDVPRSKDARRVSFLLAAIGGAALGLLALLWDSKKDTLAFEAAKGCIGILTVALVGFVASIAVQTVQRERARRDQDADRKRAKEEREVEEQREQWQREIEQQREDWRRDVERRRDERQRKDALLRSLLEETLDNYHEVKRARRLLKARVWVQNDGDRIDLSVYDEHLGDDQRRTAQLRALRSER